MARWVGHSLHSLAGNDIQGRQVISVLWYAAVYKDYSKGLNQKDVNKIGFYRDYIGTFHMNYSKYWLGCDKDPGTWTNQGFVSWFMSAKGCVAVAPLFFLLSFSPKRPAPNIHLFYHRFKPFIWVKCSIHGTAQWGWNHQHESSHQQIFSFVLGFEDSFKGHGRPIFCSHSDTPNRNLGRARRLAIIKPTYFIIWFDLAIHSSQFFPGLEYLPTKNHTHQPNLWVKIPFPWIQR